jgi:hypothetical protein
MAGAALCAVLVGCALALGALEEPPRHAVGTSVGARARDAWRELRTVLATHGGRIGPLAPGRRSFSSDRSVQSGTSRQTSFP